jgi:voltage-gated potassium channel
MKDDREENAGHGPYQLFMLALCIYVLVVLGAQSAAPLDASTLTILGAADLGVCAIFFVDFLWSLARAPRKWDYFLRWGWIDLLSSVPMVEGLRWGRAGRVLRILRVLRGVRSTKLLLGLILQRRAQSAFLAATLASFLLVVFASIAVLQFEPDAEGANITSAGDALWWAFVTITTVGYGDRFPVTTEGRALAGLLMAAGVGLFGTFTGFVASWFVAAGDPTPSTETEILMLRREIAELKDLVRRRDELPPPPVDGRS